MAVFVESPFFRDLFAAPEGFVDFTPRSDRGCHVEDEIFSGEGTAGRTGSASGDGVDAHEFFTAAPDLDGS